MGIADAATLLNVSEEYVNDLIARGLLSTTSDGVALNREDVIAYRAARDDQREAALKEMVALGENEGLPY